MTSLSVLAMINLINGGEYMEFRSNKFIVMKSFIVMIIGSFVFAYIVYALSHNESYGLITVAILSVLSLLMSISEWRF